MSRFYLVAAIVGTVVPWIFFARFIATTGLDPLAFIAALFTTAPATGFTADLLLSSVIFWVWSYRDAAETGTRHWWLVLPANWAVGLSLALPLYFLLRETARRGA